MLRTLTALRIHAKRFIRASWQFFTGVIVALVAFFGNFVDYKQPDITVEITAVTTTSSDPIDVVRLPELGALKNFLELDGPIAFRPISGRAPGYLVSELDRQLLIATNQVTADGAEIERQARQLDSLISNPKQDQELQLNELEMQLQGRFGREPSEIFPESKKDRSSQGKSDVIVKRIRKLIETRRKAFTDATAKSVEAEHQWTGYKDKILPNKARLVVTCAIGNRGAGATSLKPQGLLRANLGDGNYLDLSMKLSGYETSSDLGVLSSQSFKVMRFQSDEVQSMNPADRQRYNTFLGNVSPATIYIADVRGKTYASNSVPFSPGVYEQKVYDSLKQFASKPAMR